MTLIAKGSGDGYYEAGIHCWDIAAGDLIIREAGGVCMDMSGGFTSVILTQLTHIIFMNL